MSADERTLAVRVTGRVQGVGYRAWTQAEAARLGLRGWVVNDAAGHVDAVFFGPGGALGDMVAKCRNGPPTARVDHVDVRSSDRASIAEPPPGAYSF